MLVNEILQKQSLKRGKTLKRTIEIGKGDYQNHKNLNLKLEGKSLKNVRYVKFQVVHTKKDYILIMITEQVNLEDGYV